MTGDQIFATMTLIAIVAVVCGLFILAQKVQNRRERNNAQLASEGDARDPDDVGL